MGVPLGARASARFEKHTGRANARTPPPNFPEEIAIGKNSIAMGEKNLPMGKIPIAIGTIPIQRFFFPLANFFFPIGISSEELGAPTKESESDLAPRLAFSLSLLTLGCEVRAGWSRLNALQVRKVRTPQGRTVANGDPQRANPREEQGHRNKPLFEC